ncbi:carbamoyltransferase HypF [Legionella feeleii]|uniref:Carbamoyltransferase HypF n=1 Tax=Legionella feeleii TaxID=453 RepID=A0A0W0TVY0_9GAMM|nr:carbamoyltransferase HypF [Legionella feeleii]KTC99769.1 hydrogenase maturation protein HypF [Legionella feeleii]SPX60490.1 hydrogenase maturation protein HypF [Legionella feeleii]
MAEIERLRILIKGQVQGVGFRPHVYRVAQHLNLTGWVQNNTIGVLIEVQGMSVSSFLSHLLTSLPPLARIHDIETSNLALIANENHFLILESQKTGASRGIISPDMSPCPDCLRELFNPDSRYYYYPFLNCTQCGPRFSITKELPYDRCQTSMGEFTLCPSCKRDYSSPENRRYHAQPTACKDCGPALSVSIQAIAQALLEGKIIALKGVGGYQLLCDARNNETIQRLRQKKYREAKPLALMVLNCMSAEKFVTVSDKEKESLSSQARPIVLLKKKQEILPEIIAPGLSDLGVMLPSSPLHYLLFHALAGYPEGLQWLDEPHSLVLIATSANMAGNPLMIEDEKAHNELIAIADLVISYNRQVVTRVDDSVMRFINNQPRFIRRARGFSPISVQLPFSIPSTLALGGHLKNTFCITRGNEAFISQHIGSLTNKETIDFFHESLSHWMRFLDVTVERIACDLHPDFYTTSFANHYDLPVISVQHHQAHLAAVAAEYHILDPALGIVLDGYGYGWDGKAWGGELFLLENRQIQRLGHFYPLPQPGGERAIHEPWRMAAAILHGLQKEDEIIRRFSDKPHVSELIHWLKSSNSLPTTSSCGRLFDAASALLGINTISQYEGQAPMQLESLVTNPEVFEGGWTVANNQINFLPTFSQLLDRDPRGGANVFHGTLIAGLVDWIMIEVRKTSIRQILLSGGCFLNQVLAEGLIKQLEGRGLKVYLPQQVPVNDGGISLGQAWLAGNYKETEFLCV